MEKNICKYNALEKLESSDIEGTIYNISSDYEIRLCIYDIIENENQKPFLKFLLQKKNLNDDLHFLSIYKADILMNSKPFLEYINDYLNLLFVLNDISTDTLNYTIKGIYDDGTNNTINKRTLYLFIDVSSMKLNLIDIYKSNSLWFALIDEIINTRKICDIKISKEVTNFFNYHSDFLFIQDEKNINIEIPMVVYVGKPESMVVFTYVFGLTKSDVNESILGPYYYFTDFDNALKQTLNVKQGKKGIVRFAIFTGKMLNQTNNDIIKDSSILWTQNNDSVYLKQDNILKPIYVVKKYSQQIPLSYHYVNKNSETIL
jgi:hypothetical protein